MDILSEVIGSVRTGRAHARRIEETGSWGRRFEAFSGIGFHVVLHGRGWLITDDAPPRALRPGDVVLASFGAAHGLSHAPRALGDLPLSEEGPSRPSLGTADFTYLCGAYRLPHGRVHAYLTSLPDVIVTSPDGGAPQLTSLAELLLADVSAARPETEVTRSALVDLVLVHALRRWRQENDTDWPHVDDPAVATALRHIHRAPHRAWTVSELSAAVGMSRTAFTRHFVRALGRPPRDYLTGVRMSRAARLLRETDMPLATIARELGYSTEFAFGGAFRREYGISPGRFRRGADLGAPARGSLDGGVVADNAAGRARTG